MKLCPNSIFTNEILDSKSFLISDWTYYFDSFYESYSGCVEKSEPLSVDILGLVVFILLTILM